MSIAIKAENISKAYQLGEIGTGTLSRDLERWISRIRGKDDPFMRIGETNDRTTKGRSDVVWSLKDINFEIEQGDAVGIIGRNGAGKSTLLKILSRVTSPTMGRITGKGRIASLLEVGTGFHPELTGRENIYLNGAILGMRKHEIARKFDEIVDFAGIERYIDTPVKRYSSGMYVRLAFAVAAHLESEILIVDEVLAVGDAEFQKKCLGKMGDVSKGEGRTVLFVSHNMSAVSQLTKTSLLLVNSKLNYIGNTDQAINEYLTVAKNNIIPIYEGENIKRTLPELEKIIEIQSLNMIGVKSIFIGSDEAIIFNIKIKCYKQISSFFIGFTIYSIMGNPIGTVFSDKLELMQKDTIRNYEIELKEHKLSPGNYYIGIALRNGDEFEGNIDYDIIGECLHFEIMPSINKNNVPARWYNSYWGNIRYSKFKIAEKIFTNT